MTQKEQIDKGTYYSQLVNKSALQPIRDILEKYGYHVEFVSTKDTDSKENYGKGLDNNLKRDRDFLEGVVNSSIVKKAFKDRVRKTIVVLYNVGAMNLADPSQGIHIRHQASLRTKRVKYLVGQQYAQLSGALSDPQEVVKDYVEIFPDGVEIAQIEKNIKVAEDLTAVIDSAMEAKGYELVDVLKDMLYVSFSVQINILTIDEATLHNIQFILLKELYDTTDSSISKNIEIEYTFDKVKTPVTRIATYTLSQLEGVQSIGVNQNGMYHIGFSFDTIKAELFSDYSLLIPHKPKGGITAVTKVGIIPV